MLKMAGSGYRRFARSRLYEYNLSSHAFLLLHMNLVIQQIMRPCLAN